MREYLDISFFPAYIKDVYSILFPFLFLLKSSFSQYSLPLFRTQNFHGCIRNPRAIPVVLFCNTTQTHNQSQTRQPRQSSGRRRESITTFMSCSLLPTSNDTSHCWTAHKDTRQTHTPYRPPPHKHPHNQFVPTPNLSGTSLWTETSEAPIHPIHTQHPSPSNPPQPPQYGDPRPHLPPPTHALPLLLLLLAHLAPLAPSTSTTRERKEGPTTASPSTSPWPRNPNRIRL